MILRKPYAFLIKNFKRIHLLLCIPMIYIAYQSNNILIFLNEYIKTGTFTRTSFSLSSTYINIFMFIAPLLVVVLTTIVFILMRLKQKPKLLYLLLILFYLGLTIYSFQIYNTLNTIEMIGIDPRSIRIIRDLSTVICYAQYVFVIMIAIRSVGFDIKKFNFGQDLAELEIDISDNEEFELTVGFDPNKIKRGIRKSKREIKYFIIENKFVLGLLMGLLLVITAIIVLLNVSVYNKIYNQEETFRVGQLISKINYSYATDFNQRGVSIAPKGKSFLVVNMTFKNNNTWNIKLNLDNINIFLKDEVFSPIINRYQSFIDLGEGYISQSIKAGSSSTFIFIFEINDDTDLTDLIFRYRESINYGTTKLEAKYKKIKLNCMPITDVKKVNEANIEEELAFTSSPLGNSKLKINNYEIKDTFNYEAMSCYDNTCTPFQGVITVQYTTTSKTLMRLSFNYVKDNAVKVTNTKSLDLLINSYAVIRYIYNNKTYTTQINNKTPNNYHGADLYYETPSALKDASKIQLVITIRDKEFIYNLK